MLRSFVNPARSVAEHSLGCITQVPGPAIELQWRAGRRTVAAVQALFEQLASTHQRTGCSQLLIDERLASPFPEETKHWLLEQGLPRLVQQPAYSRVAVVQATDVYARLSAVTVQAAAQRLRLPYRVFGQEEEARRWLSQHAGTRQG